jgi:hypothetical protein
VRAAGHDFVVVQEGKLREPFGEFPVVRQQAILRAAPDADVRGARRVGMPGAGRGASAAPCAEGAGKRIPPRHRDEKGRDQTRDFWRRSSPPRLGLAAGMGNPGAQKSWSLAGAGRLCSVGAHHEP